MRTQQHSSIKAPVAHAPLESTLDKVERAPNGSIKLTPKQAERFGAELDALRNELHADLGQHDVDHMRRMIRLCRVTEVGGRLLLHFGFGPLSFLLGTSALTVSKILENMEIGHNIMHGQYDWTHDPALHSMSYEWDIVCTSEDWRRYHNYEHHTYTNIIGKDRDIGYGFLRVSDDQPWSPAHLVQPVSALVLASLFQWGVATHPLQVEDLANGDVSLKDFYSRSKPFLRKAGWQLFKDYGLFPALALGNAPRVMAGNMLANFGRNLWTFAIIFCGHFPEGAQTYLEEETTDETRGQWYVRQLNGSANIEGSRAFHIMSGHLSHQIEHHIFPDLPASRYPQVAERVRELCGRYGQAYNTGSFAKQIGSVAKKILRLSLPSTQRAR